MLQPRLALAGPSRTVVRFIPSLRSMHAEGRPTAIPAHSSSVGRPGSSNDSGIDTSGPQTQAPPDPPSAPAIPDGVDADGPADMDVGQQESIRDLRVHVRRAWGKDGLPYVRNKQKQWIPQYRPARKTRVWMPNGQVEPPMWPVTQKWLDEQESAPQYLHPLWKFFNIPSGYSLSPKDTTMPYDGLGSIVDYDAENFKPTRAWDVNELRMKSFSDLHTLWYILLRERNVLLTQREERRRLMPDPDQYNDKTLNERKKQVRHSMRNIKVVLNERRLGLMAAESPYLGGEGGALDLQLPKWADPQNSRRALVGHIDVPAIGENQPVRKRRYSERRKRPDAPWTYLSGRPIPRARMVDMSVRGQLARLFVGVVRKDPSPTNDPELAERLEALGLDRDGDEDEDGRTVLSSEREQKEVRALASQIKAIRKSKAPGEADETVRQALESAAGLLWADGMEVLAQRVQGAAETMGLKFEIPAEAEVGADDGGAAVSDQQVGQEEVQARDEGWGGGQEAKEFDEQVKVDEEGHVKKRD